MGLKAEPVKRTFWTLSVWRDKAAVYDYASTEPHKSTMARKRKVMRDSTFAFWTAPGRDLPVSWDEAHRRIAERQARTEAAEAEA